MTNTGLIKLGVALALVFALCSSRLIYAEEQTPPAESSVVIPSDDIDQTNIGRMIWAIIDTLEKHHIDAPKRAALFKIAIQSLKLELDEQQLAHDVDQCVRCGNATEFTECLSREFKTRGKSQLPKFDEVISEFTKSLSTELGPVGVVSQKEHGVNQQFQNNRYVGIGVTISTDREQYPIFATIAPGGPADRAGMKPGTVLYAVNDQSTKQVKVETVIDWIRGPEGTELTLTISDQPNEERRVIRLPRGVIRFDSLFGQRHQPLSRSEIRPDESEAIGLVRFGMLSTSTASELRAADARARADGLQLVILDLTGHGPSDGLHQATQIADSLIDGGTLWTLHQRNKKPQSITADRDCLFRGMQLIALVNENTHDGHAVIAAALQDSGRATLVGRASSFNGILRKTVPLPDLPYAISFSAIRVERARSDRVWPLVPEESVTDPNAASQNELRISPLTTLKQQKQNPVMTQFQSVKEQLNSVLRLKSEGDAVSALEPENENNQELIVKRSSVNSGNVNVFPQTRFNFIEEAGFRLAKQRLGKPDSTVTPSSIKQ